MTSDLMTLALLPWQLFSSMRDKLIELSMPTPHSVTSASGFDIVL